MHSQDSSNEKIAVHDERAKTLADNNAKIGLWVRLVTKDNFTGVVDIYREDGHSEVVIDESKCPEGSAIYLSG